MFKSVQNLSIFLCIAVVVKALRRTYLRMAVKVQPRVDPVGQMEIVPLWELMHIFHYEIVNQT